MTKKMNLATALHKGPVRRNKDKHSSGATATSGAALVTRNIEAIQGDVPTTRANKWNIVPAIGRAISKAVYGTFYYASYGIVLTAVTVAQSIPADNAMGRGVKDGAAAAEADFQKWQAHASSGPIHAGTGEYPATA